ncbi:hypothetical protein A8709_32415 [Paenibacillus pectinilyticus]|uniref:HTH cro/C1-type domain-containing protein n=1 Tax=Paenibacillus pectinilyticus TaxID=512399 RepID=A0A1C0ZWR7_9BACL|nr:helix-turn-helix transcriptional regulator [Paenibacillus pectinilyticus]OCT12527.1 hypothetical protein A8709_32415 [Paenibacillus pectinilyticus]
MRYQIMLKDGLEKKGYTLNKAAQLVYERFGMHITSTYISKLRSGSKPPATDDLNEAIAKILEIDSIEFRRAAYIEKIPNDLLEGIAIAQ